MICLWLTPKIEVDLSQAKNCVISEISRTAAVVRHNPVGETLTNGTFEINSTKFYVPLVTLTINDDTELLEILK